MFLDPPQWHGCGISASLNEVLEPLRVNNRSHILRLHIARFLNALLDGRPHLHQLASLHHGQECVRVVVQLSQQRPVLPQCRLLRLERSLGPPHRGCDLISLYSSILFDTYDGGLLLSVDGVKLHGQVGREGSACRFDLVDGGPEQRLQWVLPSRRDKQRSELGMISCICHVE